MRNLFTSATELLCSNLAPQEVMRKLQSQRALDNTDVETIKSFPNRAERVDKLLDTLKVKPVRASFGFMEALQATDTELFQSVMKIMEGMTFLMPILY